MVSRGPFHSSFLTYRATDFVHSHSEASSDSTQRVTYSSLILHRQTYGPFTRNHLQDSWLALPLEERAKRMARQGYSYTTADGARVIYQTEGADLTDVPRDGKTVGEIIVRGNLVMKEVNVWRTPSIL